MSKNMDPENEFPVGWNWPMNKLLYHFLHLISSTPWGNVVLQIRILLSVELIFLPPIEFGLALQWKINPKIKSNIELTQEWLAVRRAFFTFLGRAKNILARWKPQAFALYFHEKMFFEIYEFLLFFSFKTEFFRSGPAFLSVQLVLSGKLFIKQRQMDGINFQSVLYSGAVLIILNNIIARLVEGMKIIGIQFMSHK